MALTQQQTQDRLGYVGASEVGALFGAHPYTTRLQVYLEKTGQITREQMDNNQFIKWGNRLEAPIARGIAEDEGWTIRKVNSHLMHKSVPGMGCLQDFEIIDHPDGPAPFEIKNINHWATRSGWILDEAEEAPVHIELQLQHQMACTGRDWGAIGALRGGNDAIVIVRERDPKIIAKIEEEVGAFWEMVLSKTEPELDPERDLKTMQLLYPNAVAGKVEDLSGHKESLFAYEMYHRGHKWLKHGEGMKEAAKAILMYHAGDAERVKLGEIDGEPRELVLNYVKRKVKAQDERFDEFREFRFRKDKD